MWKRVFVIGLVLLVAGCEQQRDEEQQATKQPSHPADTRADERDAREKNLRKRINAYFIAERQGDWRTVYRMRPPSFRKAVPYESFERERSRFRKTWSISDWNVHSIKLEDDHAIATVVLNGTTTEPTLIYKTAKDSADFQTKVRTKWVHRDGTWFCLDEGVRFGSPFGIEMSIDTEFESDYEWQFEKPEIPPIPEPGKG